MSYHDKLFGDNKLADAIKGLRDFINKKERVSKEELEEHILNYFDEINEAKEVIVNRLDSLDFSLWQFGSAVLKLLTDGAVRRYYVIKNECTKCNKKYETKIGVIDYVTEHQFLVDGFLNGMYPINCEKCNSPLKLTSSVNLVEVLDSPLVCNVLQRIKSTGRLSEKLTDWIAFGKRDIEDIAGLSIVLYDANKMSTKEKKELKNYLISKFGQSIDLKKNDLDKEVCNYVRDKLIRKFGMVSERDNYYDSPKIRQLKKKTEEYKARHDIVRFKNAIIECQIKPLSVYEKEINDRSALSHELYVRREEERRKNTWEEKHIMLCAFLEVLFSRK